VWCRRRVPYLMNTSSRVDDLVEAAIHLVDTEGVEALTLRKLAGAARVSPSTLLAHLGTKHRMIDLVTKRVGDGLVESVVRRSIRIHLEAAVPDDELLPVVRAWLALSELARADDDRHAAVARIEADLRHALGRIARLPAADEAERDALAALTLGLWSARCSRTAPMSEHRARAVLHRVCDALGIDARPAPDVA
jgi:AcrR family transcriptional regulator